MLFFFLCLIICGVVNSITFQQDVTLTSKQKVVFDQFKESVLPVLPHDYMKKDIYLIKWLRASNFNLNDAVQKLIANLRWREDQKMDTIHSEDWSDMERDFKYYLDGRDKVGRSFLYFDVGTLDVRKAIIQGKVDRFKRYVDKAVDEACELVRHLGEQYQNISRGHLIINLDGYNIIEHGCLRCIPILLRVVLSSQEHWPGCCDLLIAVNTPNVVEPLLNSIRPLLTPELKQSLQIFGTNKKEWMKALSKDFDFDKLPPALGGTQIYKGMEDDFNLNSTTKH